MTSTVVRWGKRGATEAVFAVYPRRGRPSELLRTFLASLVEACGNLAIWD